MKTNNKVRMLLLERITAGEMAFTSANAEAILRLYIEHMAWDSIFEDAGLGLLESDNVSKMIQPICEPWLIAALQEVDKIREQKVRTAAQCRKFLKQLVKKAAQDLGNALTTNLAAHDLLAKRTQRA